MYFFQINGFLMKTQMHGLTKKNERFFYFVLKTKTIVKFICCFQYKKSNV